MRRMSFILWWENIHIFFLIIIKHIHTHTHISFSVILAGILRAGKKHFLGNLAVRFVCRMRSTFANGRITFFFPFYCAFKMIFAYKLEDLQTGPNHLSVCFMTTVRCFSYSWLLGSFCEPPHW